jgi:hypothetical protein
MSFVLYALLSEQAPPLSAESLMTRANVAFAKSKGFSSKLESLPFSDEKSVRLQWSDGWSANLTCSAGAEVRNDSKEIARRLAEAAPPGLERIDRRVHAFFADDPDRSHTTQMVDVMQFLEDIDGALVFDPQKNKLMNQPN